MKPWRAGEPFAGMAEAETAPQPMPPVAPPRPPAGEEHDVSSDGNLVVRPGSLVRQSLLSQGVVRVGRDARVEGAVSAASGMTLDEGAEVEGAVEVHGPLQWGRGASARAVEAHGPLVTDGQLVRAASVSAPNGIHPRSQLSQRRKGGSR